MAVHFPTSSDYFQRTSNVVAANSDYTCVFWVKLQTLTASLICPFVAIDNPATYHYFAGIFATSAKLFAKLNNNTSPVEIDGSAPSANLWYPVAYSRSGNTHSFYVAGVLIGTTTLNISAGTFGFEILGNDGTGEASDLVITSFKEWNVSLSSFQINAEINSPSAVIHTSNLITFTPLTTNGNDTSGNSNNWTSVGSPAFVSDPSFPSNTISTNATIISALPYSNTQNVRLDTYDFSVWYKYVAGSNDNVIGFLGFGDLIAYSPTTEAFSPDAVTSYLSITAVNVPFQIPVTNGVAYYFNIIPNSGNPNPASLTVTLQNAPNTLFSSGSIFISDDTQGFPAVTINGSTGTIQKYIQGIANGDFGDIFSNGVIVLEDSINGQTVLYNTSFAQITTAAPDPNMIRINKTSGTMYLGMSGGGLTHATLQTINSSGTLGPTTWDLGAAGLTTGCVNPGDTILYYSKGGSAPAVSRWDLVNKVAMTDLVAGITSHVISDMLGLDDGSILVLYFETFVDAFVKHYDSSGTLLNTYTLSINYGDAPKLAYAIDHPNSFWSWIHSNNGNSIFTNTKVSDGSTLTTFNVSLFESGTYLGPPSATPPNFGISQSCPFILLNFSPASSGTLVIGKASNPLLTGINFTVTISGIGSYMIQTDTAGQVLSVTPGTYSVTETLDGTHLP